MGEVRLRRDERVVDLTSAYVVILSAIQCERGAGIEAHPTEEQDERPADDERQSPCRR